MGELTEAGVRSAATYLGTWLPFRQRYLRVPGLQAALRFGDEVMLELASGLADVAAGEQLRTDHCFRVASHSKMFTATAVMVLVEQGRLRLDDRLGDRVRSLADTEVAAVTLRELLTHS
nr:beta-lactamase family protein [Actinomycetota bacterium]